MIKGIGIDLIELDRIKVSFEQKERFVERILTKKEQEIFIELTSYKRKIEFLAGRFAAKEAFAKAVGTGIGKLSFQHMEVMPNEKGAPQFSAKGYDDDNIFISITHSKEYAVAQVIIEDK